MLPPVKSLKEVGNEIDEPIGVQKELKPKNGYFLMYDGRRTVSQRKEKVYERMTYKSPTGALKLGEFKSVRGYNSKLKNNKECANHYAEYIAYLILKQLGKDVCKVDLGEIDIKNKYSNKTISVEGVLSYYELQPQENFKTLAELIESFREENPKKYKEMTEKGKTNSELNYVNIEIILKTLEEYYTQQGQGDKIPQMRKHFFDMCVFDLMFANRDRNDENFGVKVNQLTNEIDFYPLFDNEQILGMQEDKNDVIKYLSSEKEYEKFKGKSLISYMGIPGQVSNTTLSTFLRYLLENYTDETMDALEDIGRYSFPHLEEVLEVCPGLSEEHNQLAKKIFLERQQEIADIVKEFKDRKEHKGMEIE